MKLSIVVVQAGWVLVGEVTEHPTHVTMHNAHVIRRWGTTEGLGQLALSGPTPETQLEPSGVAHIPKAAVLITFEVADGVWAL